MNKGKSEGIYIGISGNTKQLYDELFGKPIGVVYAALGKFLHDEYAHLDHQKEIDEIATKLKEHFSRQGHSGGSALVCIQQLLDVMGSRCLDDVTYKYITNLETLEEKSHD